MNEFFRIKMLPAGYGDCFWIEYGNDVSLHRILIDGGLINSSKTLRDLINNIPEADRKIELLVCTHIDNDHINGLISLMRQRPRGLGIDDVWFNGWREMESFLPEEPPGGKKGLASAGKPDLMKVAQALDPSSQSGLLGEAEGLNFAGFLEDFEIKCNRAFDQQAVVIPDDGDLPSRTLPGGMKVTVLGPPKKRLSRLAKEWQDWINVHPDHKRVLELYAEKTGLLGGGLDAKMVEMLASLPFREDKGAPNGSSIVLLLEYAGKKALFTGDAFPSDVAAALSRYDADSKVISVDSFKVSHHGGKPNTSPKLLQLLDVTHYLISSNGVSHGHPDRETISRILVEGPSKKKTVHFNYRSEFNEIWDNPELMREFDYEAVYPEEGDVGITLVL